MKKVLYLSLIGFILVTLFVVIKKDLYIDTYLYKYISMLINKDLTSIIRIITNIGSVVFSIIIIIITSILLYKYNKKDDLKYFLIIMIIGNITSFTLKLIIARNRPDILRLMIENTYSFPSGHSMISMAFYGFIIYLIYKNIKNKYLKIFLITRLETRILIRRQHKYDNKLQGNNTRTDREDELI